MPGTVPLALNLGQLCDSMRKGDIAAKFVGLWLVVEHIKLDRSLFTLDEDRALIGALLADRHKLLERAQAGDVLASTLLLRIGKELDVFPHLIGPAEAAVLDQLEDSTLAVCQRLAGEDVLVQAVREDLADELTLLRAMRSVLSVT
ncbi:MAG: hypothetical protein M3P51_17765 [Chloroflexota bacterium]|nr:hypothetical protein [Chloroflexota bacterium]